jgi:hypothetical protein
MRMTDSFTQAQHIAGQALLGTPVYALARKVFQKLGQILGLLLIAGAFFHIILVS